MKTINLDISRKHSTPPIYAKQSEVGRKFLAVITDNGQPFHIPNDALLSVWYEGDTDAGNYSSIEEKSAFSIDGNKVTVELVAQMLLKPGSGSLCLSITHGDGRETNTWNIPYCVEYKPGAGSSVPTEYYTALTDAGARAAEQVGLAANEANKASNAAAVAEEAAKQLAIFVDIFVPVGYTFQWSPVDGSAVDLSTPEKVAAHYGFGTWEQIKDVFPLAAGDTYKAGATGGSDKHTLTTKEMPSHNHLLAQNVYGYDGWTETLASNQLGHKYGDGHTTNGATNASTISKSSTSAGGGEAFSIMPPYLAIYMWKRIA